MATLTPTLTLDSSDATTDVLAFSVTDSLTITVPHQSLSKINATATPGDATIVPASTAIVYLYVKHTGTTDGSTSTVRQVDVEFTTGEAIARLSTGEWLFMPVHHAEASVGVNLHVQHSDSADEVQMEYAYWTKG
jgi:hypothetical protein